MNPAREHRKNELVQAISEYSAIMESVRQRRCILDAEELSATETLIKAINADNPKVMHPVFRSMPS